jgi:hypothetical protein
VRTYLKSVAATRKIPELLKAIEVLQSEIENIKSSK